MFEVSTLPDEPIVIGSYAPGHRPGPDTPFATERLRSVFEAAETPIYYILDTRALDVTFSQLVHGLAILAREPDGVLQHGNVCEVIIVSPSHVMKLGAEVLKQAEFGRLRMTSFSTLEEALAYARGEIAAGHTTHSSTTQGSAL